ncbi:secreted RxLR effector protein 161-like [Salvia miltiorrhiza]|uniref:secreted RxLR effector protein 161-like n=1 Tax=Salvia miltiorrhiza TaxID=226208 RepID=UPI0025ABAEB6|nr:secreted RxLR effector protein 161-like [Salvia miltiorrhiza]
MEDCKAINSPVECGIKLSKNDGGEKVDLTLFKSLVGSLRYLTCTRPYILYGTRLVSRYMEVPTTMHMKVAKRILHYLKGTINYGLLYSNTNQYKLVGYSDNDWAGDIDDHKSRSGFVFFMEDTAFMWMSKKQPIVTLSTYEAEYVAATSTVCVPSESAFSAGARTITDRRTRLNPKSIKCCMLLKNWLDEEYRLKNLKRLERYKIAEMNEDEDSEDGEPDIEIRAQGDENEPDIERFYFPTMDYTYSSSQDPDFTYEWQHIPN